MRNERKIALNISYFLKNLYVLINIWSKTLNLESYYETVFMEIRNFY